MDRPKRCDYFILPIFLSSQRRRYEYKANLLCMSIMLGHAGLAINLMKDKEVRIMLDSETEYACLFKRFIITHIFPVLLNSPSIMFDLFDKSKTHQVRKLILQIFCLVPKSTLCIELYMCYFFKKSICIANKKRTADYAEK